MKVADEYTKINGYVHLALSSLYCMATKENRPDEQVLLILDTMQTVLDMERKLIDMESEGK